MGPEDQMKVIGKDRKRQQIDTKTSGQPLQLLFDPFLTMIKVFAGDRIRPEQEAATDNPIHDMDNRNFIRSKHFHSGKPGHGPLRSGAARNNRKQIVLMGTVNRKSESC